MGVQRTIIRPHVRDQQPSPIPVDFDPATLGWILDEGGRGNLLLQNELFNTMEDTWERLRANLNKLKQAVCKLPYNLQPWTEKGREPSDSALDKAAFVEHVLHNQKAQTWEGQHNFHATIYELLDAVARGISVLEIDWSLEDGKYVPLGTRRVPWTCLGFIQPSQALSRSKGSLVSRPASQDPHGLRLFPDRDPNSPKQFSSYPHKFLVGVYRAKSGHIAETAQLRALAHLWLGRMLGWEWMTAKAELFGIPLRWATYDPSAPQSQIDAIQDMLRNMGEAAWGAFPVGTDLQILNGNQPGVAGSSEPTERLIAMADRACDLLFLGQTLTSEEGQSGSYALGNVHREVELDLYENYAAYVIDVINNQFIPSIVELNWGEATELPFLEVELDRPAKDTERVNRDKLLFVDMGLPVAKQWLYDRHKVPAPGPEEDLFSPAEALAKEGGSEDSLAETQSRGGKYCSCGDPVNAASESTASLELRQAAARKELERLLAEAKATGKKVVWQATLDDRTSEYCQSMHGREYGDGWTDPPPAHYNCRSRLFLY
jgi:phage gp29-like protein